MDTKTKEIRVSDLRFTAFLFYRGLKPIRGPIEEPNRQGSKSVHFYFSDSIELQQAWVEFYSRSDSTPALGLLEAYAQVKAQLREARLLAGKGEVSR